MLLNCPQCGELIDLPASLMGQVCECPKCLEFISTPALSDQSTTGIVDLDESAQSSLKDLPMRKSSARRFYEKFGSFAGSFLAHLILLLMLIYLVTKPSVGNPGSGFNVGIAELPGEELGNESDGDFAAESSAGAADPSKTEFSPVEVESPTESLNPESLEMNTAPLGGGSGLASGDSRSGPGLAGGGSGGGKATFMGVEGTGNRFVIIADRSFSMAGPKLDYVKNQMLKTLGDLPPGARFYVVFYNEVAEPAPGGRWFSGKVAFRGLEPWVKGMMPLGGTDPLPAFRVAFAMNPRPQTIFFMSDGLFDPNVPAEIARLNQGRPKTVVHAISFVDRSAESLMRAIAEGSGGKYNHVDGP